MLSANINPSVAKLTADMVWLCGLPQIPPKRYIFSLYPVNTTNTYNLPKAPNFMSISRQTLSIDSRTYHFDIVKKDKNTYAVLVLDSNTQIIADLPLDPMDNTLAAVLSNDSISRLDKDAQVVLDALSNFLQQQIGGKQFLVIPAKVTLPHYISAHNAEFKRLRHANRNDLEKFLFGYLEQYKALVFELDNHYEMSVGIENIEKKLQPNDPYKEMFALLNNHANFTQEKMREYKEENIKGVKARFNNRDVKTIAIVDKDHCLCGIIRILSMGNQFAYLSDEIINHEILPLNKFEGKTIDEQEKNRASFLLAYLMSKACLSTKEQNHFILIAASGREEMYDRIGFQTFPMKCNDYVTIMKLSKPEKLLTFIKDSLCKPVSNAAIIGNLGILPTPNQMPQEGYTQCYGY